MATLIMWAATGRRYGLCEITIRPHRRPPPEPLYATYPAVSDAVDGGYWPVLDHGRWFNRCGAGCRCASRCEVPLDGPVTTDGIVSVTVNGGVVPGQSYEIHDGHLLVRVDGSCWPTCTDPTTDTFEVTYRRGLPVPASVTTATGLLACEFARAANGGQCRLPARMSRLSRQGVDVEVDQIADGTDPYITGLPEVDRVIAAVNPHRRPSPALVLTPDLPPARRVP